MTDIATSLDRPSPAQALERAFAAVQQQRMADVPVLNRALAVEAVGFRAWREHWLGVLITPWFMNLVLMPRVDAAWHAIGERETRHHVFPAGVFEFIGGHEPTLGDYQACSLFSPMFEFADQPAARATALAALDALLDPETREVDPARAAQPPAAATAEAEAPSQLSKRDFLLGASSRADRGP
ncbi:MAG: [NiFe]-hydrogenase assembly chaperone HybE [Caldimonas sp.]